MQGLNTYEGPKWAAVDEAIELWLHQRQTLLLAYYGLSHTSPFSEDHQLRNETNLENFMQLLLDYVSAGHFDIFEKINEAQAKHPEANITLDRNSYVELLGTTMQTLEFNDYYKGHGVDDKFNQELSNLGEALAHRFDLEDTLIESYLKATQASF